MVHASNDIAMNGFCRSALVKDILCQESCVERRIRIGLPCTFKDYEMFLYWLRTGEVVEDEESFGRLLRITDALQIGLRESVDLQDYLFAPKLDRESLQLAIRDVLDGLPLPNELVLMVAERLDPPSFEVSSARLGKNCSAYRRQLLQILYNSPFARTVSYDAYEYYQDIITARRNILKAVRKGFPKSDVAVVDDVGVAPDCRSYFTLGIRVEDLNPPRGGASMRVLEVWSLLGENVTRVMHEEDVAAAGYIENNRLWVATFLEGDDRHVAFEIYSMAPRPRLKVSWKTECFKGCTISRNAICTWNTGRRTLWTYDEGYTRTEIHFPEEMEDISLVAFSPTNNIGVFCDMFTLFWRTLDHHFWPIADVPDPDPIDNPDWITQILFSPDGRRLLALGDHTLRLWYSEDPQRAAVTFKIAPGSVNGKSTGHPDMFKAVFSPDSKFIMLLLLTADSSYLLLILEVFDSDLREIYRTDCGSHETSTCEAPLATFLDRFVVVKGKCLDLGSILGRDW